MIWGRSGRIWGDLGMFLGDLGGDLKAFSGDMGVIGVGFSSFLVCPSNW